MHIFDDANRDDNSYKQNQEPYFQFYNRCSNAVAKNVRNLLESCFRNYSDQEQEELRARIRSGDDRHFQSAVFELLLHEIMMRAGYQLEPHPRLPNGSASRPDFLVTGKDGESFYLEAVLAAMSTDDDRAAQLRKNVVYDYLSRNPHGLFLVNLYEDGNPATQPSGRGLLRVIHSWLDSLDHNSLRKQLEQCGPDSMPAIEWSHEDWSLVIKAWPLEASRVGLSENLIGVFPTQGGWINAWTPIRDSVKLKNSKYGDLDRPLVVAVNFDGFVLDRIDEVQALFGQEQFMFKVEDGHHWMERAKNGVWNGPHGPQCKRVTGVWIFDNLSASGIRDKRHTIYINPSSNFEFPRALLRFPHALVKDQKLKWYEGITLNELFELNEDWPLTVE